MSSAAHVRQECIMMGPDYEHRPPADRAEPAQPAAPPDLSARRPRLLPYQHRAVCRPDRFTWNNWSRQTGKSFTFTLRRLIRGLHRRRNQILLSAGERQARELMLKVRQHCFLLAVACELRGAPFAAGMSLRRTEARLPNNVRIIALPANPMTARGFTADVFLDEFAMHHDDRAIWAALLPALLRGNGELDIASTPRGRGNVFHRLADNPRFVHTTLTLPQAIAQGLEADEAAIRDALADEALYRQEFLCEFDADDEAFLRHELIVACADPNLDRKPDQRRLADATCELYAGVDVGRVRDLTVIWLWQRDADAFVTRGVVELHQLPFDRQRQALDNVLCHRSVRRLCIDATGIGRQLAEDAARQYGAHRVEPIVFTPAVQSELASRLRVLAERGRLFIPADDRIHNDWHSLRRHVTSAGHVRYRATRSAFGHADRFWAAALGLHAADAPAGEGIEYESDASLNFARIGAW